MNPNHEQLIDAFTNLKVLVIGEAMLDSYLTGASERLCREAPVPVVSITQREHVPGGAANTAVNLKSLGAEVVFLSVTGDDGEGAVLRRALQTYGVATDHILAHPKRQTLAKQRIIAGAQMVVRFDQGSTHSLESQIEKVLIQRLNRIFSQCDAIVVSDYDYGVLTPRVIEALARLQARDPHILIVDSKRLTEYRRVNITAVKPNYNEMLEMLSLQRPAETAPEARLEQVSQHGARILELTGAQIAAITLDQEGALIFQRSCSSDEPCQPYRTYARPAPHSRAAGAGDTFVSALTLALAAGAPTENAAELASAAASIVVGKEGTAVCFADELRSFFQTDVKFVTDVFQLVARMTAYRQQGRRIVFTNGCFDILHRGHITYLNRAKACGDILIVGLNSDDSVRRLKGPSRPINTLEDRAQVLAALSCVDHIVPFDADTPHELIRVIQPDVFVKGGDYTRETLPEAALVEKLGGEVKIMSFVADHSTTSIIERIRLIYAQPPASPAAGRSASLPKGEGGAALEG